MCNCGNYCPTCGQLKPQSQQQWGWYDYRTYPYPTWHPTSPWAGGAIGGGLNGYTTTDGLGQQYDASGAKIGKASNG